MALIVNSMFTLGVFSNRLLFVGVTIMIALQLLFTYLPAMQQIFGTANLGVTDWLHIVGIGVLIYGVIGCEKWIARRLLQ